jgi:hypothetical protein
MPWQPPVGSVKRGHGGRRGRGGLRRYLVSGMVAAVLVLFSAVVWFAYQDLMPGGDAVPPLIRADAGELKRDPDERGGLPVVNEESAVVQALEEPESPARVERIVPRETVAPRSTADVIPEALEAEPLRTDNLEQLSADAAGAATAAAGAAVATEAAGTETLDTLLAEIIEGPGGVDAIEPGAGPMGETDLAQADALPLPNDGLLRPEDDAPLAPAAPSAPSGTTAALETPATASTGASASTLPAERPATLTPPTGQTTAAAPAAAAPATPAVTPSSTAVSTTGASGAPAATAPASPAVAAAPAAEPTPAPAPAETVVAALPSPTLAPNFDGAFRVQLLAVQDEAAAAGAWTGLQAQFPGALAPLRSQVQRAEIGGSTYFRLHAGPFADRASADAVCASLQAQGADCFVVAPTS